MARPTSTTPPPRVDQELLRALRGDLERAAYTAQGLADCLGAVAGAALQRERPLPAERVTRDDSSPTAALVRLFVLGLPVAADRLDPALPRVGVAGLAELGLARLERDDDGLDAPGGPGDGTLARATCELRPYGDDAHAWWVASDLAEAATGAALLEDHVLGLGGASATLASWTPRPQVDSALDLGTGCGVQALHLGGHAERVVATDLSQRALAFARFNAALNDLDLDVRAGNLLEPVTGERFGLIVSNPPFVITPRAAGVPLYEYRDGGLAGDAVVETLVRRIGDRLEPGGIAQLLGNWEVPAGSDWRERVDGWLEGAGVDGWVIQRETQDPAEYAETWARDGGHRPGTPEFDRLCAAWLSDFDSRDVASIGFGVVTLQRPATDRATWRDLVDVTTRVARPMGPTILAGLAARTWLAEHGDRGILDTAWRCADDVTEERHWRPGAEDPNVILIRQGGGLGRAVQADTVLAALVGVCDGGLTAAQALDAIADLLGASPEAVRDQALPQVRELVADGLLVPPVA